jgi:hypothetical protein
MRNDTHTLRKQLTRSLPPLIAMLALVMRPAVTDAATNRMELPISQAPVGLQLIGSASHTLTLDDVTAITDASTASQFRQDGWKTGYEERMEGAGNEATTRGCRVLIDAFVFNTDLGTRMARTIWTAGTPGQSTLITHLPASAKAYEELARSPGTPGWDVQIVFRIGTTLSNVDARCDGKDNATLQRARALAARVTRSYDAWIAAHPPQ